MLGEDFAGGVTVNSRAELKIWSLALIIQQALLNYLSLQTKGRSRGSADELGSSREDRLNV